jgi:4-amino-4-deoxy-L-arabinose transferase-like glycosyltransferase
MGLSPTLSKENLNFIYIIHKINGGALNGVNVVKERKGIEGLTIGCFIIFSGVILFFNLWARSLENHGYLRYAEVAREMIRSGDWIVPHLNGEVFVDKPPLLFWLIAIPSSIYGSVTPFLAKWPSAFSAWMGVIILFLWGKRIYGTTQSGLIAGGVLLSSYQYFSQARLAKTDTLLCLFILLSLYFFTLGYGEVRRKRSLFYGLSFFSMGLGVLTKGPFGLVPPFIIISALLIKERRWRIWISREFLLGYIILALTVLPWIFLFISRVGLEQYISLIKGTDILTRKAPIYFYFIEIWGQFFPWSLLLPFLFFYLWRQRNRLWHSRESFFLIWFIVLFTLLTLFKYRASRYLLPVLPPLALMIGGVWRKRVVYFLISCLFVISIWHVREYYWIKKDLSYSPGMVLVGELKPFIKESTLFGFRLDMGTIEEVNFYLDRVLPLLRKMEDLLEQFGRGEERWILMPKEVYEETRIQGGLSVVFVQEFLYKHGKLVLVSIRP